MSIKGNGTYIDMENFLTALREASWSSLPRGDLRFIHSVLNHQKPHYLMTIEALTAYLTYSTLRWDDPKLARYFASRTVDFWPLLVLDTGEVLRDLPPYPVLIGLALERRGYYDKLSSYLSELGVEIEDRSEVFEQEELLERIREAYSRRLGSLGRLIGGILASRRIGRILDEARYTREGLEIDGERYMKNWLAFVRSYIPIMGLEGLLYAAGNLPSSVRLALLWLTSYILIYGPLTALSYRLKLAGELGGSRVVDAVRTLVWVVRSPLMALETLLELKYGGRLLRKLLDSMEGRSKVPHLLAEVITSGNVPLGPLVLALNWPPGERPLLRRRASEEKLRSSLLDALRRIGECSMFPSELVEDTAEKVEKGLIRVGRLRQELIGETGRLELVSLDARADSGALDGAGGPGRAGIRPPVILDSRGRLRTFWYKVGLTDLYSGDYLLAIAMKEAYALLLFRRYEWMVSRQRA